MLVSHPPASRAERRVAAARRRSPRTRCASCAAALAADEDLAAARAAFDLFAYQSGCVSACTVGRDARGGRSLLAARPVAAGELLLSVPSAACLRFRRDPDTRAVVSWATPQGLWPRVDAALTEHAQLDGLPWDVAAAAALLDAFAGDGGPLWSAYARALLPLGQALTLPLTFSDADGVAWLGERLAGNAAAQRERLAGLLPRLAPPPPPGGGASLSEAFALVRSRAFALGDDEFALVALADLANHAAPGATAALLVSAEPPPGEEAEGVWVHLRALRALAAGEEVTFDYTQQEGYSNERFLVQHGFVPLGGNRADRLQELAGLGAPPLRADWLQASLGDVAWMGMVMGGETRLFSALKSMAISDDGGEPGAGEEARQLAAVGLLRAACPPAEAAAGWAEAREGEAAAAEEEGRLQLAAALRFRAERARLWRAAEEALARYEAWLVQRAGA